MLKQKSFPGLLVADEESEAISAKSTITVNYNVRDQTTCHSTHETESDQLPPGENMSNLSFMV